MSSRAPSCAKCGGGMDEGFVMDEGYGSRHAAHWVEGAPVRSLWTGLKLKGRTRLPVRSWRCRRCHYLEQYAPPA